MSRDYEDWQRIEVMDDAMAEVLRRKTPAERIAIGFGHNVQKRFAQEVGTTMPENKTQKPVSIGVKPALKGRAVNSCAAGRNCRWRMFAVEEMEEVVQQLNHTPRASVVNRQNAKDSRPDLLDPMIC